MVFFTCDRCGESIKKNQVEKHQRAGCRSQSFSCMDCNQHFYGQEFQSHTKCITEEQKYAKVGFVPKENKGEVKQQSWVEQVQMAIAQADPQDAQVRSILNKVTSYTNIPRKEKKFISFLMNSMNVRNEVLAKKVWAAISAAAQKPTAQQASNNNNETPGTNVSNSVANGDGAGAKVANGDTDVGNGDGGETFANGLHHAGCLHNGERAKKKGKKRKLEETADGTEPNNGELTDGKRAKDEETAAEEHSNEFKWRNEIRRVLDMNGGEMKLKKLRKKVLKIRAELCGPEEEKESETAVFDKKLAKIKNLKVDNGKVIMIEPEKGGE